STPPLPRPPALCNLASKSAESRGNRHQEEIHAHLETDVCKRRCRHTLECKRRTERRSREDPPVLGGSGHQLGLDPAGEKGPRAASRQNPHPPTGSPPRGPP